MRIRAKLVPLSNPDSEGFWLELNIPDGTEENRIFGDRFALEGHSIVAFNVVGEGAAS